MQVLIDLNPLVMLAFIGDETLPVTLMINADGEDTTNPDECVVIVAGPDADMQWVHIDIRDSIKPS